MNKFLDQFAKTPLGAKAVALLVILGLIAFGEYQFYYSSLQAQLKAEYKKVADLNVTLLQNQDVAKNLPRFQEEVAALNEKLRQALSELPNEADVHSILRQLSMAAKKTGVDLQFFRPGVVKSQGFYSEISIELRLSGSYHDLAIFMSEVGRFQRIMNISDIVFSSPVAAAGGMVLTLNCKLTTFMFRGGA